VRTARPYRVPALALATGVLLCACSAPPTGGTAVYRRPGDEATAATTTTAPATVARPVAPTVVPPAVVPPTVVAPPAPRVVAAPAPAPTTGSSDKGSRLARPTPIGQIAPEEAPPAR
jgi:hypothetical protein